MRLPAFVLIVAMMVLLLPFARSQDKVASPRATEESARKIAELRKQRIEILKGMAEASQQLVKNNRLEIEQALKSQITLLQAELNVAENASDRIALCKKTIETLNQYEEIAKARKANARGTELSVLEARAARLEVEILMEQASPGATAGSK